ncbi:MAG: hypothetical protein ACI8RZ_003965, partial [Myxococcota bacterium]
MSVLLALTGLASAGDVLWYTGHSSLISTLGHTRFDAAMTTAGSNGVDELTSWPADISDYRMLVLAVNAESFSEAEVSDLSDYLAEGGLLVLVGEVANSYFSDSLSVLNDLLADLGLSSSFSSSAIYDSDCGWSATVTKSSHSLTSGFSSLSYAYSGEVNVGSSGVKLLEGYSGQALVAYEDRVVLAADANIFDDSCTLISGNTAFFTNLYSGVCTAPDADEDGDGYIASACGGEDCNDFDELINPQTLWYYDADADGYGDADLSIMECQAPLEFVANASDCDDKDGSTVFYTWYADND